MLPKIIIINFEEIYLKGKNQKIFVKQLLRNIKRKLKAYKPYLTYTNARGGSYFIELDENIPEDILPKILYVLSKTPGITGFYVADTCGISMDEIIEKSLEHVDKHKNEFSNFAVRGKRINKSVPFSSMDIGRKVGSAINLRFGKGVNLTKPEFTLHIKVRGSQTVIYSKIISGIGGLPVGTSGKAIAMLSGGIDSPVSTFMAMNRGLHITAAHFHSVPKTSPKSIDKVKQLTQKLTDFQGEIKLYLIPILEIQEAIAKNTDAKLRLILLRRIMLKIGEKIAETENAKALITGDSLGQVASQTLENMSATEDATNMPVIRPLVALDKKYIIQKAEDIGTFQISILPHDDTCALFTPKSPETKANLNYVRQECSRINVPALVDNALEQSEIVIIHDRRV